MIRGQSTQRPQGTILAAALALLSVLAFGGCESDSGSNDPDKNRDFRQDMMDFVVALSAWARQTDPGFIVIPQNGHDIYSTDFEANDPIDTAYFAAIDGLGREDLRYGYLDDNVATDTAVTAEAELFLDVFEANGKEVLVTDYINTSAGITDSFNANSAKGYISFQAFDRGLNSIPPIPVAASPNDWVSGTDVFFLTTAVNFLYVLDPGGWASRSAYLTALGTTNHDVLIVDAFDIDQGLLTGVEVDALQFKDDGAVRLAIAYMSIGEAENFRYYWQSSWDNNRPDWMDKPNPEFPDDFKVRYWDAEWQAIVFGNAASYLQKILAAGFDGVYLDIIDGYEYWEEKFGR